MSGESKLFIAILMIAGVFFFLLIGVQFLHKNPVPDENLTPSLAKTVNETETFSTPIILGWRSILLVVAVIAVIGVISIFIRRMRRGRRGWL